MLGLAAVERVAVRVVGWVVLMMLLVLFLSRGEVVDGGDDPGGW